MPDIEKVIHDLSEWCDSMDELCPVICLDVLALLKEQTRIVRCKDCRWRRKMEVMGQIVCVDNTMHSPDWYCADGERLDDDA